MGHYSCQNIEQLWYKPGQLLHTVSHKYCACVFYLHIVIIKIKNVHAVTRDMYKYDMQQKHVCRHVYVCRKRQHSKWRRQYFQKQTALVVFGQHQYWCRRQHCLPSRLLSDRYQFHVRTVEVLRRDFRSQNQPLPRVPSWPSTPKLSEMWTSWQSLFLSKPLGHCGLILTSLYRSSTLHPSGHDASLEEYEFCFIVYNIVLFVLIDTNIFFTKWHGTNITTYYTSKRLTKIQKGKMACS